MDTITNKPYLEDWVIYFPDHFKNSRKDRESCKAVAKRTKEFVENPTKKEFDDFLFLNTQYRFALAGKVFGHSNYRDGELIITTYVEILRRTDTDKPLRATTISGEDYYINAGNLEVASSLNELYQCDFFAKPHNLSVL